MRVKLKQTKSFQRLFSKPIRLNSHWRYSHCLSKASHHWKQMFDHKGAYNILVRYAYIQYLRNKCLFHSDFERPKHARGFVGSRNT